MGIFGLSKAEKKLLKEEERRQELELELATLQRRLEELEEKEGYRTMKEYVRTAAKVASIVLVLTTGVNLSSG